MNRSRRALENYYINKPIYTYVYTCIYYINKLWHDIYHDSKHPPTLTYVDSLPGKAFKGRKIGQNSHNSCVGNEIYNRLLMKSKKTRHILL